MIAAGSTIVQVDIENDDGVAIFQAPVYIDYIKSVERAYGEDADGRQGVDMIEFSVLDKYLDADTLRRMRSDQVERALESAEHLFNRYPRDYVR